jgi:hypothetical protein
MDKPARGRTHPHNFPEKERSEGQENTAAAVEVRLPSPEDDYAEPDFESVFSTSHQLAPRCTRKQKPSQLLWLGPVTICMPLQRAARHSGTKYHHLYPQKPDDRSPKIRVDRYTSVFWILPAPVRAWRWPRRSLDPHTFREQRQSATPIQEFAYGQRCS